MANIHHTDGFIRSAYRHSKIKKKDLGNAKLRHIFAGHIILVTVLGLAFMTTGVLFRTGF